MSRIPDNGRIGNLIALALTDAKPGESVWVDSEGCEYVAVPSGNAATNAISGPNDPEPTSWQPKGPIVLLPNGSTAAASRIRTGKRYTVQSGELRLELARVPELPSAADIATGEALLTGCDGGLWSSLVATETRIGAVYSSADLLALSAGATNATIVSGISVDGGPAGVVLLPNAGSAVHGRDITVPGVVANTRAKLRIKWSVSAGATGQCDGLGIAFGAAKASRIHLAANGQIQSNNWTYDGQFQENYHWVRPDGVHFAEIEWQAVDAHVWLIPEATYTGETYAANGTTGINIFEFEVVERTATALTQLSTASVATATAAATAAPWIESGNTPKHGWQADHSPALKLWCISPRVLNFSSTGYGAISGTAKPFKLTWMSSQYMVHRNGLQALWTFTGAAGVSLTASIANTGVLVLSRTNAAGGTVTATFTRQLNKPCAAVTLVCDGANAVLYIQGVPWETQPFSLAGTTVFTSGCIGGALALRISEFAFGSAAWTAEQVRCVHIALCTRRGVKPGAYPMAMFGGQSNGTLPKGEGKYLPDFGGPSVNGWHYEYYAYEPVNELVGWGPAGLSGHIRFADSTSVNHFTNAATVGDQGFYGPWLGLHERWPGLLTVYYAQPGSVITNYMPPSGIYYAGMLATLAAAISDCGVPVDLKALVYIGGEAEASSADTTAVGFGAALDAYVAQWGTYLGNATPAVVLYELHKLLEPVVHQYAGAVRQIGKRLAATRLNHATFNVDDQGMNADRIHLNNTGTTVLVAGERISDALASLGI